MCYGCLRHGQKTGGLVLRTQAPPNWCGCTWMKSCQCTQGLAACARHLRDDRKGWYWVTTVLCADCVRIKNEMVAQLTERRQAMKKAAEDQAAVYKKMNEFVAERKKKEAEDEEKKKMKAEEPAPLVVTKEEPPTQ